MMTLEVDMKIQELLTSKLSNNRLAHWLRGTRHHAYEAVLYSSIVSAKLPRHVI